ncbi:aa3-type cytochrome c oxidase subunit IV [Inquilinus limosus]
MASEGSNQVPDELLAPRKQMYASFVRFSTWGIVAVAILLIGMALFLL